LERPFILYYFTGMASPHFSFLALGDSYTIGEGVPLSDSFPWQTVRLLRKTGRPFSSPELLARTGWTSDELAAAMLRTQFLPSYDFVTLLIGANNQYRGRDREEYGRQFEELLQQAIRLATPQLSPSRPVAAVSTPRLSPTQPGASASTPPRPPQPNVFVLSIPDWSVTPFANANLPDAKGRDRDTVSREIDAFNTTAMAITRRYGIEFLDITEHTRLPADATPATPSRSLPDRPALSGSVTLPPSPFAADGLHPSGAEYAYWAKLLAERISKCC
jgi:lysophospholipase L1-like esterase